MTNTPTKNACQEGIGVVEKTKTEITTTEGLSYHVQEKIPRKDTTGIPRMRTIKGRLRQETTYGSEKLETLGRETPETLAVRNAS